MPIVELHPRTFSRRFGEPPRATRTFLDSPKVLVADAMPVLGEAHPENASLVAISIDESTGANNEKDEISYTVTYEPAPTCEQAPDPVDRCDRWTVTLSGSSVPCTTALVDNNGTLEEKTIRNAAGDVIPGLKKRNADVRLSVQGNREKFPLQTVLSNVNKTNDSTWGTGSAGTWLCTGASATQKTEMVGALPKDYWEVSFEFLFRPEGWKLKVPDVGMNYLRTPEGGSEPILYRCMVRAPDSSKTPAPNPQPLTTDGTLDTSGEVRTMELQIYREVNFSTSFGDPPNDED